MRLLHYIDCVDVDVQYIENRQQNIVIASIFQNVLKYIDTIILNVYSRLKAQLNVRILPNLSFWRS